MVGVNEARRPYMLPFHVSVNEADAPVLDTVSQRRGLRVNEPATLPEVILTDELVVRQPDNLPVTAEGPVPPPEAVTGGEKVMVADSRQVTCPGAGPT